jgi:HEAT repeat protein
VSTGAEVERLLKDLRREAGWENLSGARQAAVALAALPGDEPVKALWNELVRADGVDLSEDAGDVGDELWRLRQAVEAGFVELGARCVPFLRERVAVELREGRHRSALKVLGLLGETAVAPIAEAWVDDASEENQSARWVAIEVLGRLRVPGTEAVILRALANPGPLNEGWLKRLAAVALARLGNVEGLEVLLDDPHWFARLGVAEGLKELPGDVAKRLRPRVEADVDERVRAAARER